MRLRCLTAGRMGGGPPFAKDAKMGHPALRSFAPPDGSETRPRAIVPTLTRSQRAGEAHCGGVGGVHGSFVGSPWLRQGLRCLRMTAAGHCKSRS